MVVGTGEVVGSMVEVGCRVVVGTGEVVTTGLGSTAAHRTLELLRALFSGHMRGQYRSSGSSSNWSLRDSSSV